MSLISTTTFITSSAPHWKVTIDHHVTMAAVTVNLITGKVVRPPTHSEEWFDVEMSPLGDEHHSVTWRVDIVHPGTPERWHRSIGLVSQLDLVAMPIEVKKHFDRFHLIDQVFGEDRESAIARRMRWWIEDRVAHELEEYRKHWNIRS